jgi:hypothetical protein
LHYKNQIQFCKKEMASFDTSTPDNTFDMLCEDHDKHVLNIISDAVSLAETKSGERFNYDLNVAWDSYYAVKHRVAEAIVKFRFRGMKCDNMAVFDRSKTDIRSKLGRCWRFGDPNVSYQTVARCLCTTNTPENVVDIIREDICNRESGGMITQLSDLQENELANIKTFAMKELWFVLFLFAADPLNETIALHYLNTLPFN